MSSVNNHKKRPISPFMIGPYYRPQLTSMTSIAHRISGLILAIGGLFLAIWLQVTSLGPEAFECFSEYAGGPLGFTFGLILLITLIYHFFNGIRHLFWDIGWGLDIRKAYRNGWIVIGVTITASLLLSIFIWMRLSA